MHPMTRNNGKNRNSGVQGTHGIRDRVHRGVTVTWRRRVERGSMSIEMVLLTPALVACILVLAAGARYVDARGQTSSAAFAAARAASLTSDEEAAIAAGREAASRSLADRGQACFRLTVHVDAGGFHSGGHLRATVTCVADLSDLTGFGLPGSKSFRSTAVVPIEDHRVL